MGYWLSDLVTVSTWEAGSSILVVGLGTSDAVLIMLVAGLCNMIPTGKMIRLIMRTKSLEPG
jgi:nucleobase:cation symporter-1, NCS1 family